MGIEEFNIPSGFYPISMAIGGVETSLLNLTQAYSVIANNGELVKIDPIIEISDHFGNLVYQREPVATRIVSKQSADYILSILSDQNARMPMFGYPPNFNFGNLKVAIKTGTSNDTKDNVAVAFNKDFVVAVWSGNNNGEPMYGIVSGYNGASEIMHRVAQNYISQIYSQNRFTMKP